MLWLLLNCWHYDSAQVYGWAPLSRYRPRFRGLEPPYVESWAVHAAHPSRLEELLMVVVSPTNTSYVWHFILGWGSRRFEPA